MGPSLCLCLQVSSPEQAKASILTGLQGVKVGLMTFLIMLSDLLTSDLTAEIPCPVTGKRKEWTK